MQLDLKPQLRGILRKALDHLVQRGSFSELFAEQILGEHQIDGVLGIVRERRERLKIRLGWHAPAAPEPLRLVYLQNREDLFDFTDAGFRDELLDLGLLSLAPEQP
jgi:hypothetical protein